MCVARSYRRPSFGEGGRRLCRDVTRADADHIRCLRKLRRKNLDGVNASLRPLAIRCCVAYHKVAALPPVVDANVNGPATFPCGSLHLVQKLLSPIRRQPKPIWPARTETSSLTTPGPEVPAPPWL